MTTSSALDEDLFVIAEEFGNWEDARRRIDLLALDKAGRLVVIELKRTDDGGHMELQAIRYAAMVSSTGFAEVADAYSAHRAKHRPDAEGTAQAELAAFLDAGEGAEDPVISTDVRLMLVSADFGREITTVLWLNGVRAVLRHAETQRPGWSHAPRAPNLRRRHAHLGLAQPGRRWGGHRGAAVRADQVARSLLDPANRHPVRSPPPSGGPVG